jgi:GH15 family glucan-1,4-alpha-glucosidase
MLKLAFSLVDGLNQGPAPTSCGTGGDYTMASRIESYGLIGDLQTAALVSSDGSLDWLCVPRFDSDACFAALVGYDEHGRWAVRPTVAVRERHQRYRGDTLILETDVVCDGGAIRLIEFMPATEDRCDVVRIVEGVEGEVPMEMIADVRFGYGANTPWIRPAMNGFGFVAGPDAALVRGSVRMDRSERGVTALFSVKQGDRLALQFNWHLSHRGDPPELDAESELARTERFWLDWSGRCTYQGRWREAVMRSLITLKALSYAPTGGIIAAPTTSLPEELGGVRNWDYRYCWLRDASLTIVALTLGGYLDEAIAFRDWLLRAAAGAPRELQIMYDLGGGRRLTEFELPWLPGYEGSKPVRVGNAASDQFQLDVYGEVAGGAYLARKMGMAASEDVLASWGTLVDHVSQVWQHPDNGLWEVRGGRRHFTYSKVMAWVAIDRSVRLVEEFGEGGAEGQRLLPHLHALRQRIHEEVCQRGFHPGIQAFTQYYGAEVLDASMLLIPHAGFLPPEDPRVQGTVRAIERTLLRDGFVLRYETEHQVDGLPGSEGAFLACSFWLADNYAFAGRMAEAEELFERLLALRSPLGLLAEEYDSARRRQVGNFPQGFSHLALIASAHALSAGTPANGARQQHVP